MIRRLRLMVIVARPAVVILLGLFADLGLAQTGHGEDRLRLAEVLVVVAGFLLFSVACNDLADEAIDRVNLPGDRRRPLVAGTAARRDLVLTAVTAAVVTVAASALLPWPAIALSAAGLALSAGYSLRPVRFADRGAVASMMLPACYVAVPYLLGVLAGRGHVRAGDLTLLAGLYVGFVGRILLKDFRDVRGDALFGKRTFLVRHGRRWTCAFSAGCWTAGTVLLMVAVHRPTPMLVAVSSAALAGVLVLLRALAAGSNPRRDEALISAAAIVGRGTLVALLAHLSMTHAHISAPVHNAALGALGLVVAGQAVRMVRRGPVTSLTVPTEVAAAATAATSGEPLVRR